MDRWSRRWESGEVNKERVRDIVAEVSKKADWEKGSAEQLSGLAKDGRTTGAGIHVVGVANNDVTRLVLLIEPTERPAMDGRARKLRLSSVRAPAKCRFHHAGDTHDRDPWSS